MKKPSNEIRLRVFVVAGAGLEPRDLRVMSPTSYLTAPPRINLQYYTIYRRVCQPFLRP